MLIPKGLLQRMQLVTVSKPLKRHYLSTISLYGQ
jgi:hypothetical protein